MHEYITEHTALILCVTYVSAVCIALNIGLINQAAWQVNVKNGWEGVWNHMSVVCRCVTVSVCEWWRERDSQLSLST